MNIQLKTGQTFIHSESGLELTQLFGGIKLLNMSIESMTLSFKIKFYISSDFMIEGKKEIYQDDFVIQDI